MTGEIQRGYSGPTLLRLLFRSLNKPDWFLIGGLLFFAGWFHARDRPGRNSISRRLRAVIQSMP